MLCRGAVPADLTVADAASMGLKIFVNSEEAVDGISERLTALSGDQSIKGRGPIHLILSNPELPGEVELALPGEFPMNPQVKGALKHIGGVLDVVEF